ncbi:MAG: methyltransferase [Anaerolineae bacterium]
MSFHPHPEEHILQDELNSVPVSVVTRFGFPEWDEIGQATRLLATHAQIEWGDRVLIFPCGHGALALWAATRTQIDHITLRDTNLIAAEMARRTAEASHRAGMDIDVGLPPARDMYDVILMSLPKGRDLARLFLLSAYKALRDGGRLYLAGANKAGIKSVASDAEALFGRSTVLGYKGGHRAILLIRPSRANEPELPSIYRAPGIEEGTFAEFDVSVGEHVYHIRSRPGVFSWEHLDAGTRLLLEHTPIHVTDRVLDVGCGYGIIGIHAARIAHKGHATLVDVDALACQSARASLEANGIRHADVIIGDGLKAVGDRHYTLILSNPPFHSGHRVTLNIAETFVRDAYTALEPRGRLVIVANRFLPYDRIMNEVFGAVTTLAQTSRFHLLLAEKARLREAPEKKKPVDTGGDYEETIYQIPD